MNFPQRPQWNDPQVKDEAAKAVFDDFRSWALSRGVIEDGEDDAQVLAALSFALYSGADGYGAARELERAFQWPSDGKLVDILSIAYRRMVFIVPHFVREWVMENNVRFPADKGVLICFRRHGSLEAKGVVIEIISREARAIVKVGKKDKPSHISVNAEDVVNHLQIVSLSGKPKPPTGGSPANAGHSKVEKP